MPDLPVGEGDDAVRLLAVQRELTPVLGRCQTVMVPDQDQTLLIRAWIEDDSHEEQVAFITLSEAGAVLREVAAEVAQHVEQGQETLDRVAETTAASKDATDQAVTAVTAAAKSKFWLCNLVGPILGLIIILGGILLAKLTNHLIVIPVVIGIVVGGVVFFVCRKFINWRARTMKAIETDVGRIKAWAPFPAELTDRIRTAGLQAQLQLTEAIEGTTWTKDRVHKGMQVESSVSCGGAQIGSHAFKIQFEANVSAKVAFNELERLRMDGKLDPRCKAMWSRPVDSDGTHVRYSNHSFLLKNREFLTVCRSSIAQSTDPSSEMYVCALASLSEELTALSAELTPKNVVHRGLVHLLGVSLRDTAIGACRVDVLTDIDPQFFACSGMSTRFSDRTARHQAYLIASELQRSLTVKAACGSTAGDMSMYMSMH